MMMVISRTISVGSTPFRGWWIIPDTCACSVPPSSCSASTDAPWISLPLSNRRNASLLSDCNSSLSSLELNIFSGP